MYSITDTKLSPSSCIFVPYFSFEFLFNQHFLLCFSVEVSEVFGK
jgi:hypothetical protein